MKLSIILPVYNGESTLKLTLDSLVNQSFNEFEVIACIDGTKDNSKQIIESYNTKFKGLTILENKLNRGLGSTMNRLVYEANGEYIAIAEQDDYYYPDRLKQQVEVLNQFDDVGMVSGIADFWNGEKITSRFPGILVEGKQYPSNKDMFLLNYKKQIKVANSCMMFRKSTHVENGLYFTQHYPSVGVDWTYVMRFSLVSNIYGISNSLVRLDRRQDRSSVTSKKQIMFKASRELIRSFAYEFPNLISKNDYKYALNTQRLLELGHFSKIKFAFLGTYYSLRYFNDKRFVIKLRKRILKK